MYFPLGGYRGCVWEIPQGREDLRPANLIDDAGMTYAKEADFYSMGEMIDCIEPKVMQSRDKFGCEVNLLAASVHEAGGRYVGMFIIPIESNQATAAQMRHVRLLRAHWEAALGSRSDFNPHYTSYDLLKMLLENKSDRPGDIEWRLGALGFNRGERLYMRRG